MTRVNNKRFFPFCVLVDRANSSAELIAARRTMASAILAIMLVGTFYPQVDARSNCRAIVPVVSSPRYAKDYPLPISLRRNLVFFIQRKMKETNEYEGPIDGVYHLQLEAAVRRAQKRIGEESTGCLTWRLIEHYAGTK